MKWFVSGLALGLGPAQMTCLAEWHRRPCGRDLGSVQHAAGFVRHRTEQVGASHLTPPSPLRGVWRSSDIDILPGTFAGDPHLRGSRRTCVQCAAKDQADGCSVPPT